MSDTAPDTSQGVSVGDAVLTFLGDTTHLDAAFNRVADEAAVSMGKAASSVGQVGDAVDGLSDSMAVGQQGAVKLGEVTTLAGKQARESMYQARGETQLLGEMFGIHLPRHVRSFIAELPGVGTALSAAFTATAVLFLLDALVKGIEKIKEFANIASEIQTAWEGVDKVQRQMFANLDDNLLKAGARTADLTNNPLEALRLKLQLLDNQSLAKLDGELEKLGQEADKAFDKMDRNWFSKMFLGLEGAEEAKNKFDEVGKAVDAALSTRTPESFANALKAVDQGIDGAKAKLKELEEQQKQANASNADMGQGPTSGPDPRTAHAFTEAIKRLEAYKAAITEAQNTEHEEADNTSLEEHLKQVGEAASAAGKEASRQAAEAQHALNDQLENIKDFVSQQHSLYENHKIDLATLQAAEVHATDATAIAHEHYLQTLVRIYQQAAGVVKGQAATQMDAQQSLVEGYAKSGDAVRAQTAQLAKNALEAKSSAAATDLLAKAQSAQEELATLRKTNDREATDALNAALEKQRENTRKVVEEYAHLVDAGVEKEFLATARAAKELSAADEELSKAQTKLAEDKLTQKYKDQEDAITKLAAMHLITEEQKDDRLKLLEQQQADAAIAILNQQLAKEKAAMDAAQATVSYGKNNPLTVSPAQLAEAEASLAKLATAYTNTQAQIVEAQEKFHKESEANDKSHYGRAFLEAAAFGQEILAEQLKQNHAALLAAEGEEAQAKARGVNTAAIHKEIEALKENEKALEREANGSRISQAEKQKNVQLALASAQQVLAEAKARGTDTAAMEQNVRQLQQLEKATQQVTLGDKALLAQLLLLNKTQLLRAQQLLLLAKDQGMDTTAIEQNIKALKQQQIVLNQENQELPKINRSMVELRTSVQQAATTMLNSFSTAMAGVIKGQESFGAAMEKATLQMLGQMAQHWAEYFLALAIGNVFTDPAAAAEEFAAAAALELVSGTLSGLASSGGSSGSGTQSAAPTPGQTTSSSAGGGGTNQTGNVTHLAAGGVVSQPTMFMAGDSPSGGAADEAILPLSDPDAMHAIAKAIAPGGQPEAIPESGFDAGAIDRMTKAIAALTGTRNPSQEFHFAEPGIGEKPGFQFDGSTSQPEKSGFTSVPQTVGQVLGFSSPESSPNEKREFAGSEAGATERQAVVSPQAGSISATPEIAALATASVSETPAFVSSANQSPLEKQPFTAAAPSAAGKSEFSSSTSSASKTPEFESTTPTVGEALGFASAQPSTAEKSTFVSGGEATASEKQTSVSPLPASVSGTPQFVSKEPTVGEALGFTSATPSASEKSAFSSDRASGSSTDDFSVFAASASSPSVGEALGFTTAPPSANKEAPFTHAEPKLTAGQQFTSGQPSATDKPEFLSGGVPTVGEALGFTPRTESSADEKPLVSPTGVPSAIDKPTFTAGGAPSSSEKPTFDTDRGSASKSAGFNFGAATPSVHDSAGFSSGEPSPGEKSSFSSGAPSETEKSDFLSSQPSVGEKPAFNAGSPTVGEALGFKFDTPYPGDKPVFSSGQPSAPEKPGFSLTSPSANDQRDFAASSPTVGDVLGFSFSAPRLSHEGLGFTSGQPSSTATQGFSSGVASPSEKPTLDFSQPSAGERPGFNYSAPSLPREMPDMESLATQFGGLLSAPTLRAASDAHVPAAAVSASSSSQPVDIEGRMERFAEKMGAQSNPDNHPPVGDTTHIHVKGLMDAGNLKRIIKKQNLLVKNRQATVNASNSLRITRRSQ